MSEKKSIASRNLTNALILVAIIGIFVYWVSTNPGRAASVTFALVGLGVMIFVHEFGHFLAGKLTDINVEAFALGFGPIVLGVKKFENFLRLRILPTILVKNDEQDDEGLLCFKIPLNCRAGETEYQLRIFPIGGFVKLLGQEDIGADKPSDDPRSFLNKPVWKRIVVASAGVFLNVVLALVIFIVVFTAGIRIPPAIIGDVVPGFPAEKAGLAPGDEVLEIDGKTNIYFSGIDLAGALSDINEPVNLKVKRTDGSISNLAIVAEKVPGAGYRGFGVLPALSLEIAKVEEPEKLYKQTGLKAGDTLIGIDDERVEYYWQVSTKLADVFEPNVTLTFQREGQVEPIVKEAKLNFEPVLAYKGQNDFVHSYIYGLIPRLKIISIERWEVNEVLRADDVIVQTANVANPTFKQLRQAATAYAEKELALGILRDDRLVNVTVTPRKSPDGGAFIGIGVGLDVGNPVVAAGTDMNMFPWPQDLAGGAKIVSIDGKEVKNYFDIAAILEKDSGKTVKIEYSKGLDDKKFDFAVPAGQASASSVKSNFVKAKATLSQELPFKPLKKLYRAAGPIDAIKMGYAKTVEFIALSYMTLKGLIIGSVSPKSLMGPVGMIAASSRIIAEKEFIQYLHFMGIISACLAVMNFLPLPILDGGLVVMLIIEKIKGSPVSIKIQEWLTYAGIALLGALFVLITYNDIIRVFFNR
ncbi:MAG: site-2 protease family protein [Sedimentisphaerales bacterium]